MQNSSCEQGSDHRCRRLSIRMQPIGRCAAHPLTKWDVHGFPFPPAGKPLAIQRQRRVSTEKILARNECGCSVGVFDDWGD
jgi:hypothetical protein